MSLSQFWKQFKILLLLSFFTIVVLTPIEGVFAKRPPETRNQEQLEISADMHGRDLNGYEFVKVDLRGIDLSESDLRGAVFNNSKLEGVNLKGADLQDVVAFASSFEDADLRDVNFTNALLMESTFKGSLIEGADFTNAVINRIQLKQLCEKANGTNSQSGQDTSYSLGC